MLARRFASALLALAVAAPPAAASGPTAAPAPSRAVALAPPPPRTAPPAGTATLDGRLRSLLAPSARAAGAFAPATADVGSDGRVAVSVRVRTLDVTALAAAGLAAQCVTIDPDVVEGRIAPADLAVLGARPDVISVRPVERATLHAGSVTSAGDVAAGADRARMLGVDGSGVVVGAISDGIGGLATLQASGDLPAVTVPLGCTSGSGSEGSAVLEVVHDLAPGASLRFASGVAGPCTFVEAVKCLRDAGARVIVDDLSFVTEPFFQDGAVAQAVREAVAAGVSFHSVAGNLADRHYEATYRGSPNSDFHRFEPSGDLDNLNDVAVAAGTQIACVLQWDDPIGASANDYDLHVYDAAGSQVITASEIVQDGNDDPIEVVAVTNAGASAQTVGLAVLRHEGAAAKTLELVCVGTGFQGMQWVTPAGSILGHAGVTEVVTSGAVDVANLGAVQPYSGQGPSHVAFPAAADRPKPDLVAFDGVRVATPAYALFRGTSAAAPHTAAVAALMLQRNPLLDPAGVRATLVGTAADIGAPGFDTVAGAGRLDAFAAVSATAPPECLDDAACDDDEPCTVERCEAGRCMRGARACDDGDPCNGVAVCATGVGCVAGTPLPDDTPCDDASVCNGDERCRAGACVAGTPLACADEDPCTVAACDATLGCVFPPLAGPASVSCVLDAGLPACADGAAPAAVERRFARAVRLVAHAGAAQRPPLRARLLIRAARQLARAGAVVRRSARRGALPEACADATASVLADAEARARRAAGR